MAIKYGLLLPHFGEEADRDKILQGSSEPRSWGSTPCGFATT